MATNFKSGKDAAGQKGQRESRFGGATVPGTLYDRHGPIPVPDMKESDTDSAWAMFEESVLSHEQPNTRRDDLRPDLLPDPRAELYRNMQADQRTDFANTDIAPPEFLRTQGPGVEVKHEDFEPSGFEQTRQSPL